MDRRSFLRKSGIVALVPIVPVKLIQTPEETRQLSMADAVTPHQLQPGEFFLAIRWGSSIGTPDDIYAARGLATDWEFDVHRNMIGVQDEESEKHGLPPTMIPGRSTTRAHLSGVVSESVKIPLAK